MKETKRAKGMRKVRRAKMVMEMKKDDIGIINKLKQKTKTYHARVGGKTITKRLITRMAVKNIALESSKINTLPNRFWYTLRNLGLRAESPYRVYSKKIPCGRWKVLLTLPQAYVILKIIEKYVSNPKSFRNIRRELQQFQDTFWDMDDEEFLTFFEERTESNGRGKS